MHSVIFSPLVHVSALDDSSVVGNTARLPTRPVFTLSTPYPSKFPKHELTFYLVLGF